MPTSFQQITGQPWENCSPVPPAQLLHTERRSATKLFPGSSSSTLTYWAAFRYQVVPRFLQLNSHISFHSDSSGILPVLQTILMSLTEDCVPFQCLDYVIIWTQKRVKSHYLDPENLPKCSYLLPRTAAPLHNLALCSLPMFGLCHYLNPEAQQKSLPGYSTHQMIARFINIELTRSTSKDFKI